MNITIGTCSICGGPVVVSPPWHGGTAPSTPTCSNCGATRTQPHGPVIPMTPQPAPPQPYKVGDFPPFIPDITC